LLQELVSETDAHLFVAEMLVFRRPARKDWFPFIPGVPPSFSSLVEADWPSRISHNPRTSNNWAVWRSCGIRSCSTITWPWYMKKRMAESSL
jgi:hypothetical protein